MKVTILLALSSLLLFSGVGCKKGADETKPAGDKPAAAKADEPASPAKEAKPAAAKPAAAKPAAAKPAATAAAGPCYATQEDLAKALFAAANARDAAAVRALFPSDVVLDRAVTCKEADDGPKPEVARERKRAVRQFVEKAEGFTFAMTGFGDKRDPMTMAKGTTQDDCTFNEDVEIQKVKLLFKVTKGAESDDEKEGVTMMKTTGGGTCWYLIDM